MTPLTVRTAREADLPTVQTILDDAARWLAGRGVAQWPVPYPTAPSVQACAAGRLWLGERQRRVVATLRTATTDPDVWGDDHGPALYVHGLATRRTPTARGSGADMLRWAVRTAARDGLVVVRLDCAAGNRALRRYYEEFGFRHVDDVEQVGGGPTWRTSRYELRVPGVR